MINKQYCNKGYHSFLLKHTESHTSDMTEPVYEIHLIYFVLNNFLITFILTFSFMQLTPSGHHFESVTEKCNVRIRVQGVLFWENAFLGE